MSDVIFTDNSGEFINAKNVAVERALEAIGLQAEGYAKMLCPVDTGRLKNSIIHQQEDEKTEIIATDVEYGPYVEFGTSHSTAQPYMQPAASDHTSEYKAIAEEYLKNA